MLKEHLVFRTEHGLDQPTEGCRYGRGPSLAIFHEIPEVKKHFPHCYHKMDRQGRPIYIELIGKTDLSKVENVMPLQPFLKYFAHESERQTTCRLPACSLASGRLIEKTLYIMDLQGISFNMLMTSESFNVFKLISKDQENNFPEITGATIIINAPM